jgi:stage V sporulation protein AA
LVFIEIENLPILFIKRSYVGELNALEGTIYIRMRNRVQASPNDKVKLKDVAQIIASENCLPTLQNMVVHQISDTDQNIVIIDVMKVIKEISNLFETIDVQTIGPAQTIVEVMIKKKSVSFPFFLLICFCFSLVQRWRL